MTPAELEPRAARVRDIAESVGGRVVSRTWNIFDVYLVPTSQGHHPALGPEQITAPTNPR